MSDIKWITVKQAAGLLGVTKRAIRKGAKRAKYRTKSKEGRGGNGGKHWLIDITSLPPSAQEKWVRQIAQENQEEGTESPQTEDLTKYTTQQIKEANRRYDLVEQFCYIIDSPEPRKAERAKAFVEEKGISLGTLYRWRKAWLAGNRKLQSLIPHKDIEKESKLTQWEKETFSQIYLRKENLQVSVCYGGVQEIAEAKGKRMASYSSYLRYARKIEPIVKSRARGRKKEHRDKFRYVTKRGYRDLKSNTGYCGDHHQLNIWVIGEKGQAVRPWITPWEDLRSRSIAGFCLVEQASSASIALAARHAFLKKEDIAYPQHGLPDWIHIDNGKDYSSRLISGKMRRIGKIDYDSETKGLFRSLGVDIRFAIPKSPESKPLERFFGTLDGQLIQALKGYCGNSTQNKPDTVDGKTRKELAGMKLYTLEELYKIIEAWIMQKYHRNGHRGEGMDGKSPLDIWMENLPEKIQEVDPRVLNILLMKGDLAKVTREGVRFKNHLYDLTEELIPYQERYINVRYNPNQMGRLWCWDGRNYIGQTANKRLLSWDATEEDYKSAGRVRKAQRRFTRARLEQLQGQTDGNILKEVIEKRKSNEAAFREDRGKALQKEIGKRTEMLPITDEFAKALEVKEDKRKTGEKIQRQMSEDGIEELFGEIPAREEEPELLFEKS